MWAARTELELSDFPLLIEPETIIESLLLSITYMSCNIAMSCVPVWVYRATPFENNLIIPLMNEKIEFMNKPRRKVKMRRAFVNKLTRRTERILGLKPENQAEPVIIDQEISLPPTPSELINEEREAYNQELRDKFIQIEHLLRVLPREIKRNFMNNPVANRIRELLADVRIEQIPERMLEILNDWELL